MSSTSSRAERHRRLWDRQAPGYDQGMAFFERHFFGDTRDWVCAAASGDVLEIAVGTGLNLPHYPADVRLTGIEWSDGMLQIGRRRAAELRRDITLLRGDAQRLPFADASFDTVVCTFSLCAIPDDRLAVTEMVRVLRPGGLLLLADHVSASRWWARLIQGGLELVTVPVAGEHFRRRPIRQVQELGLRVERHDRFKVGIIERLAARKPS